MKDSKSEAQYRERAKGGQRCHDCSMFRPPHSCTAVAGHIYPDGWCRYFEKASAPRPSLKDTVLS